MRRTHPRGGQDERESDDQAWWRGTIDEITTCPNGLQILDGFARKLINEEIAQGRWPELEAGDLVGSAILRGLSNLIAWPRAEESEATTGWNGSAPSKAAATDPGPAGLSAEGREAMWSLCKTMRNECRSSTRTRQRHDRLNKQIPSKRPGDPGGRVIARTCVLAALPKLPEMQRKAFVEIKINDQHLRDFARENGITDATAKKHLTLAKRRLRGILHGHACSTRDGDRAGDRRDSRGRDSGLRRGAMIDSKGRLPQSGGSWPL